VHWKLHWSRLVADGAQLQQLQGYWWWWQDFLTWCNYSFHAGYHFSPANSKSYAVTMLPWYKVVCECIAPKMTKCSYLNIWRERRTFKCINNTWRLFWLFWTHPFRYLYDTFNLENTRILAGSDFSVPNGFFFSFTFHIFVTQMWLRYDRVFAIANPSVVCNVRAPYSGGWNFRQYFFAVLYLSHPLKSVQKFYRDRPRRTPPSASRALNARGLAK